MSSDTIFLDAEPLFGLPSVPSSVPGYVKHVVCEGSHSHVPRYASRNSGLRSWGEVRCSQSDCIYNHAADQECRKNGVDP